MIFNHDNLAVNVLDVFRLSYKNFDTVNTPRKYHALSFRTKSDAVFVAGNDVTEAKDNSLSYVPANLSYNRKCTHDDMIVIHFELFNYISDKIQVILPHNPEEYHDLFTKALEEFSRKAPGYRQRANICLLQIFSLAYSIRLDSEEPSNESLAGAINYMKNNFTDPTLTIAQLSHMAYMSEAYFRRCFNRVYGISPKKYLTDLRISYAISLLHTEYFSIKEIAMRSGFGDEKHFSTVFKKVTGSQPTRYKDNSTFKKVTNCNAVILSAVTQ